MVWLSLSARVLLNVGALNMVESVGNYTRHRRAPMVIHDENTGTFTVRFVPAISGESIAHAYQVHLTEFAERYSLPVCDRCAVGEFVKRGVQQHTPRSLSSQASKKASKKTGEDAVTYAHNFEKAVIKECVVEDVAGFLYPFSTVPVKRTSCIQFGYMIPALDNVAATALEPEFHVRYTQTAARGEQAIYYVEVSSAIYVVSSSLDVSRIGYTSMIKREPAVSSDERLRRIEAAINALYMTIGQGAFGAKRSRSLPDYQVLSMIVAVSRDLPFNVRSGHCVEYIKETVKAAKTFREITGSEVKLIAYVSKLDREMGKVEAPPDEVSVVDTVDNVFREIKRVVLEEYRNAL